MTRRISRRSRASIRFTAADVVASGLFNPTWYRDRYPDIAAAGVEPADHYAAHGWREGRWPNPWFDADWYRTGHGLPAHQNPLHHYVTLGAPRDLTPHPDFDPAWYRSAFQLAPGTVPLADFLRRRHSGAVAPSAALWPALGLPDPDLTPVADDVFLGPRAARAAEIILRAAGVFDENHYALQSGDVLEAGVDPLAHYCTHGWHEGRQPSFYFESDWYAATNPDPRRLRVNPLVHYVLVGEPAGRRPIVFFDPVWYAKTNGLPRDVSPLGHFLTHRRDGTVSPNALFNPAWYAAQKGETFHPGQDPFARFLMAGLTEDIPPSPDFDMAEWRRRSMGRVSRHFLHLLNPARDNPLVHYLLSTYR